MDRFDRTTWRRLRALALPFFTLPEIKWKARGMLILVVVLAIAMSQVNVLINYISGRFTDALVKEQNEAFFQWLIYYLLSFLLASIVSTIYTYSEQRLNLGWRRWLAQRMLEKYFRNLSFYRISSIEGIDNPDQRLEEDIRSFTATTLSLCLVVFNSLLTLFNFIRILWTFSGYVTIAAVLYPLVGSIIIYAFGRPLIRLDFEQRKKEANYRYKLVNVRDNAESIAFYRGARKENTRARQRLKSAIDNLRRVINLNRNLDFFRNFYQILKPVLPVIIVSPLYLSGKIEFGDITRSVDAFVRVVDALSIMVTNFGMITSLAAVVTRLGTFAEAVETVSAPLPEGSPTIKVEQGERVEFDKVSIRTPQREKALVTDLSFLVKSGGFLITGASGSGKSSILRVIAGLWEAGSGRVIRPDLRECIFLPQRPYMVLGSLRNQLLYSMRRKGVSDRELREVLEQVGLGETLERIGGFDAVLDWPSILSTGEQQRLAFARLVLSKARYVFLDEATTALDTASEAKLYLLLEQSAEYYVSVGYHTTLAGYHETILQLFGGGRWALKSS